MMLFLWKFLTIYEQDVDLPDDRRFKSFAPIVSFYAAAPDRFTDIPWPSSEDWEAGNEKHIRKRVTLWFLTRLHLFTLGCLRPCLPAYIQTQEGKRGDRN